MKIYDYNKGHDLNSEYPHPFSLDSELHEIIKLLLLICQIEYFSPNVGFFKYYFEFISLIQM